MELSGASAIVTGGASGIGAASARALTNTGARCVLVDLNELNEEYGRTMRVVPGHPVRPMTRMMIPRL